jgi:hypothetical protein
MATKWSKWVTSRDKLSAVAREFLEAVRNFDPDLSETKGRCGKWSAKDIVSHIIGWESEVVKRFQSFLAGDTADIDYDIDAFNSESVNARKHLSWKEVTQELESARKEFDKLRGSISEENINAEKRFLSWTVTLIKHYRHHMSQLTGPVIPGPGAGK